MTATPTCFDVQIADHVAHIKLNRPDKLNAMNRAFWHELPAIIADINDNARARCIVISSTGKHFSAGMDLSVFTDGSSMISAAAMDHAIRGEALRKHILHLQDAFACLDEARMPVLAAIQGGCIGGAVDMTSACDIRYATADAFFCIQEINIGITADVGTFPRLCKLMPEGQVRELAYTGRRLPAARAQAIGLVNEVYPDHASDDEGGHGHRARDRQQEPRGRLRLEGDDQLRPRSHDRRRARLHRRLADRHAGARAHEGSLRIPGPEASSEISGPGCTEEGDLRRSFASGRK